MSERRRKIRKEHLESIKILCALKKEPHGKYKELFIMECSHARWFPFYAGFRLMKFYNKNKFSKHLSEFKVVSSRLYNV